MRNINYMALPEIIVYFIQMDKIGPIKIGITKNLKKRLMGMQTANPYKLNVLYCYSGLPDDEESWHNTFKRFHIRGEWFHPADTILFAIKDMVAIDKKRGRTFFEGGEWELHYSR